MHSAPIGMVSLLAGVFAGGSMSVVGASQEGLFLAVLGVGVISAVVWDRRHEARIRVPRTRRSAHASLGQVIAFDRAAR